MNMRGVDESNLTTLDARTLLVRSNALSFLIVITYNDDIIIILLFNGSELVTC